MSDTSPLGGLAAVPSLRRSATASLIAFGLVKATMAAAGIVTARTLGPGDKGILASVTLAAQALGLVALAGADLWVTKELSAGRLAGVRDVVGRRWRVLVALPLLVALATIAVLGGRHGIIVGGALLAAAHGASLLALSVPLGLGALRRWAVGFALTGPLVLIGSVSLASAGSGTVGWFLVVNAGALAVSVAWVLSASRRLPRGRAGDARRRDARRFGWPASLGNVLTLATYRCDLVVLAAFVSLEDLGRYAVASSIVEALWLLPDAAGPVLVPSVARDAGHARTSQLTRIVALATLLGGALLSLVARPLIGGVFGHDYLGAERVIVPLALGAVSLAVWKLLVADLAARGHGRIRATSALLGISAMLVVDVATVPSLGILGGGLGVVVGYTVAALVAGRAWLSATGAQLSDLLVPRASDLGAVLRGRRSGTVEPGAEPVGVPSAGQDPDQPSPASGGGGGRRS